MMPQNPRGFNEDNDEEIILRIVQRKNKGSISYLKTKYPEALFLTLTPPETSEL